jgi:hypothetical protein
MKYLLLLGSLLLVACGSDKTLEQYERDKLNNNLALYQSVSGTYTGVVQSKEENQVLGAMELNLRAETQVNPGGNGDTASGTPILVGNVRFLDEMVITLTAPTGYYDPNTGAYSAEIRIAKTGDGEKIVNLSGNLANGSLQGEIATRDFPGSGGKFQLVRGGRNIYDLLKEARPQNPNDTNGNRQVKAFLGATDFKQNEVKRSVRIVLLQPIKGNEEDLLDIIDPIKKVQVSFNYSQTLNLLFANATYDIRQGTLSGGRSIVLNGQTQEMSLDCLNRDGTVSCNHFTTGSGLSATTMAKVAAWDSKDPPDTDQRKAVSKTFVGKGVIGGRIKTVKLSVTEPVRPRLQELEELFAPNADRIVNASVNFAESVDATFTFARWDRVNGIIDASFSRDGGGGYTAYLQCQNFHFLKTKEPFACQYWTTRSPVIQMDFTPPFTR